MFLQEQSLQILQQVINWVDVGVCLLQALDVCLGGSRVGKSGLLGPIISGEGWNQLFQMRGQISYEGDRPFF